MVVSQLAPETTHEELVDYLDDQHSTLSSLLPDDVSGKDLFGAVEIHRPIARFFNETTDPAIHRELSGDSCARRIPTYLLLDLPAAGQRIPTYLFWGGPIDTCPLADRHPGRAAWSRRCNGRSSLPHGRSTVPCECAGGKWEHVDDRGWADRREL